MKFHLVIKRIVNPELLSGDAILLLILSHFHKFATLKQPMTKLQLMINNRFLTIKKVWIIVIFTLFNLYAGFAGSMIPDRPNPPRLVNDLANVLPDDQEAALEKKLVAYDDSTSTQIAVVTVQSLGGDAPYNFAQEILSKWGVGQAGKNNGVVILVAPNERQTFITTGYGLESELTDARCKRIIETEMIPSFRNGNYYEGIDKATTAIIGILSGLFVPDDSAENKNADIWIAVAIFLIYMFIMIMISYINRNRRGGGGRTFSGRGVSGTGPVIIHWGDSDFGSFSGGSGSFGGFGGGSGGGGGAGGSW
ncbi:MAG: TPM domain-containing protein [Sphingobacteriales bacterium]|nr:MAG: TPM domain-containing protein [Sphingobacteriales bacterium]